MTLVCQSISTIPVNALLVQDSTANHSAFQPAQLLQYYQVNSHNSRWPGALVPQPPYNPCSGRNYLTLKEQELNLQNLPFLRMKRPHISTVFVYSFTLQQNWYKVSAADDGLLTSPPSQPRLHIAAISIVLDGHHGMHSSICWSDGAVNY